MSKLDGAWLMRHAGVEVSTDDLTLDELDVAERACGTPYVLLQPLARARDAKALLAVCLIRGKVAAGASRQQAEDEALAAAGSLTLGELAGAFQWVPATDPQPAPEAPTDPPSSAVTSAAG